MSLMFPGMHLLKVIQIDIRCKLDLFVVSAVSSDDVELRNVAEILLNHVAVLIQIQFFIKFHLILEYYLVGSLNQKRVSTCVAIRCKPKVNGFHCLQCMSPFLPLVLYSDACMPCTQKV